MVHVIHEMLVSRHLSQLQNFPPHGPSLPTLCIGSSGVAPEDAPELLAIVHTQCIEYAQLPPRYA